MPGYLERLKKLFPVENYPAGGFILPDGDFLSMMAPGYRQDHRAINQVLLRRNQHDRTGDMWLLMSKVNLVRYLPESVSVQMVVPPTRQQIRSMRDIISMHDRLEVEVTIPKTGISKAREVESHQAGYLDAIIGGLFHQANEKKGPGPDEEMENPKRSSGRGLIGLGVLTSLEILEPSGRTRKQRVSGKWLAWDPARRSFSICRVRRPSTEQIPASIAKAHRRFHQAAPERAVEVDAPEPIGAARQVGLVKALTYLVPSQVRSPEKNPHHWHHAFGDIGHKGGDHYPERVMPALVRDARGNLFIRRRKGNIFRVDTWLRG